jgi:predicted nucleotidyltransferase
LRWDPRLLSAVERIVAPARPETVLLFGSRARGDGDDASDWDLFVVLPDNAPPIHRTWQRRPITAGRRQKN